ncbi:MAG TPA: hypothetical protein VKE69_09920, partial [Planctomycetota bacterium]|nr:hypothetical protein [Planctomycetota bacterium]
RADATPVALPAFFVHVLDGRRTVAARGYGPQAIAAIDRRGSTCSIVVRMSLYGLVPRDLASRQLTLAIGARAADDGAADRFRDGATRERLQVRSTLPVDQEGTRLHLGLLPNP